LILISVSMANSFLNLIKSQLTNHYKMDTLKYTTLQLLRIKLVIQDALGIKTIVDAHEIFLIKLKKSLNNTKVNSFDMLKSNNPLVYYV
jgi:hypothetical protein